MPTLKKERSIDKLFRFITLNRWYPVENSDARHLAVHEGDPIDLYTYHRETGEGCIQPLCRFYKEYSPMSGVNHHNVFVRHDGVILTSDGDWVICAWRNTIGPNELQFDEEDLKFIDRLSMIMQ